MVSALAIGPVTITATLGTFSDYSNVTVTAATLSSIAVTPANPSVAKGSVQQFTATGTYSDGTLLDVTTQVTWSSSATTVATISNVAGSQGKATTVNAGSTTITATSGTIAGSTTLTVTAATLSTITVTPAAPSVARTYKIQFTATGNYSDSTQQNLTALVTWTSSNTAYATISNTSGSNGLATAVAAGTPTITATYSGKSGSTTMTVTTATLSSIAVTPVATINITVGQTVQLTATGTFSNGTKLDLTTQASWTSGSTKTATVSAKGLVTGVRARTSTVNIKATMSGKNGTTKVKVS